MFVPELGRPEVVEERLESSTTSLEARRAYRGYFDDWVSRFSALTSGKSNAIAFLRRAFELHPRSIFTQPFLWLISLFFRKAIDKHLDEMAATA